MSRRVAGGARLPRMTKGNAMNYDRKDIARILKQEGYGVIVDGNIIEIADGNVTDVTPGALADNAMTAAQVQPASPLALQFEFLWSIWNGPALAREYKFHTQRRWRLDYYHAATRTAIELEGGLYSNGRHTRTAGFLGDIEKYNAATMHGIALLRLGTGQVDPAHVAEIISYIERKQVTT
jgi:hypothetical protein